MHRERGRHADEARDAEPPSTGQPSLEAAFAEHFPAIYRFASRRVGGQLAEDIAAETFAVACRRWDSFQPARGTVRAWLFGIATVLLRAHRREERELLTLEARIASRRDTAPSDPGDAAFAQELAPRLADALARLSSGQREVLLLYAWGELSSEEISVALGLRATTVRARLSRARAQVRKHLSEDVSSALADEEGEQLMEGCER